MTSSEPRHGFSEPCITKKSIVNVQVSSFLTLLLEFDLQYGILDHLLSFRTFDRVAGPS